MTDGTVHRLADGTRVRLRPLRPEDRDELRAGFARLSPESKYRRFFAAPQALSDAALEYLTHPDGRDHVAIGAELAAPDAAGRARGIGIARFVRLPDEPTAAEAAVAVIDDMQRRGVGRLLLRDLVRAARERGVSTFVCHVLPGNTPVRAMLRELASVAAPAPALEDGVLTYRLALPQTLPGEPDGGVLSRVLRLAAGGLRVVFRLVPGGASAAGP